MSGATRIGIVLGRVLTCCLMWSSANASEQKVAIRSSDTSSFELEDDVRYPRVYAGAGFGKVYDSSQYNSSHSRDLYKLFVGTSFSKYLGTELTFLKMEGMHGGQGNYAVQVDNYSWLVAGVATLPLSDHFEVGLKLGYANYNVRTTSTTTSSGNSNGGWTYGVFTTVNVTDHIALRAEYEGADFGSNVFTIASLSGIYKF